MAVTLPGVETTLVDGYAALSASQEAYTDRVVIIGRTGPVEEIDADYAHNFEAKRYTRLSDVATVHGESSELYEAWFHAYFSGCVDIWLCPIPETPEEDRTDDLNTCYEGLYGVRPSIIVPYGRGAKIEIATDGTVTRSIPQFGDSPQHTDGAYIDCTTDYSEDLAAACLDLSTDERLCIGILGFEAFSDITPSGLITEIGEIGSLGTALTNLPDPSGWTNPDDGTSAKYLQVVLGEMETAAMAPWPWRTGDTQTYYRSNGALNYAGLISRLAPHDATTGKTLAGASFLGYQLSRNQKLACISEHVVTVEPINGIARVVDGVSFAADGSDYVRLSTVRIMGSVDEMVRRIAQKFIGRGMNMEMRNSLITNISSGLTNLQRAGAILDADFRVRFDGVNYAADIDMVIVPAWELRRINLTLRVAFQGIERPAGL